MGRCLAPGTESQGGCGSECCPVAAHIRSSTKVLHELPSSPGSSSLPPTGQEPTGKTWSLKVPRGQLGISPPASFSSLPTHIQTFPAVLLGATHASNCIVPSILDFKMVRPLSEEAKMAKPLQSALKQDWSSSEPGFLQAAASEKPWMSW
jgi:hypothetical protein